MHHGLHPAPGGRIKGEGRGRAGRAPSHLCVITHLQALSRTCCHEVWPNTVRFTPSLVVPSASNLPLGIISFGLSVSSNWAACPPHICSSSFPAGSVQPVGLLTQVCWGEGARQGAPAVRVQPAPDLGLVLFLDPVRALPSPHSPPISAAGLG